MQPSMEAYSREIEDFTEKYGCLAKMTLMEEPDIDTREYIFSFESVKEHLKKSWMKYFLKLPPTWRNFQKEMELKNFRDVQWCGSDTLQYKFPAVIF